MIINDSRQDIQALEHCEPGDQLFLNLTSGRSDTFTFSRVLTPQEVVEVIHHPLGQKNFIHLSEISRASKIDPYVPGPTSEKFLDVTAVTEAILHSDPDVPLILFMEMDTHYLGSARILEEGRIFEFTDLTGNPYKLPMNRVVSIANLPPEARWGRLSLPNPTEKTLQELVDDELLSEQSDDPCNCIEASIGSLPPAVDTVPEEESASLPQPIVESDAELLATTPLSEALIQTAAIDISSELIDSDDEPESFAPVGPPSARYLRKLPLSALVLSEYERGNSYKSPDEFASKITYSQFASVKPLKGRTLSTPEIEDAFCTSASYWLGTIQFRNGLVASGGLAINILRGTGRMICSSERWSVDFNLQDVHRILELKP